jgi:hypothetical protein
MNLDISILDTNSPRTLAILDLSKYDSVPTSASVQITIPGFNTVSVTLNTRKVTIVNSNTLGISNVTDASKLAELPDGIYKVVYTLSGTTVTKSFMRIEKLRCKYENAILKSEMSDMKKLIDIEFLIQSSVASANVCNNNLAVDLYKEAGKRLDNLLN